MNARIDRPRLSPSSGKSTWPEDDEDDDQHHEQMQRLKEPLKHDALLRRIPEPPENGAIDVPDARAGARRDPGRTMSQDAAQCDGLSRDPRVFVSLRQLLHPGTEPTKAAMMLLTVVGLGANVASALCWPTRRRSNARHLTRKSPESGAGKGATTRPADSASEPLSRYCHVPRGNSLRRPDTVVPGCRRMDTPRMVATRHALCWCGKLVRRTGNSLAKFASQHRR